MLLATLGVIKYFIGFFSATFKISDISKLANISKISRKQTKFPVVVLQGCVPRL